MFSSTTYSAALSSSPQPLPLSSDQQLCYVHCNICDTVLAVSVPCSSLFKTVTVRCGHCTNLLPVTMRGLLLPATSPNQFHHLGSRHSLLSPPNNSHHNNLLEEIGNAAVNPAVMNQANLMSDYSMSAASRGLNYEHPKPLLTNRPPEKRQRVPSAYNRFIKDEIQRIKAGNPDISHREAFSAAAKNWAHFPHIHFGLMSANQTILKNTGTTTVRQQGGNADDNLAKDSFNSAVPNIGFSPTNYQF